MELGGKVAVVTGGASGIGAALCRRFSAEGAAAVVVADLDESGAGRVADEIGGVAFAVDVADEDRVRELIATTEQDQGRIDLLCLNAGIATGGGVEASNEDWQRIWEINLMSHVYAARAALPAMLARGDGYLLHTASAAGLLTNIGAAPYSVTKHAVVALAEWLAVTHGDQGLKVSCLCPQFVDTPMLDEFASLVRAQESVRELAVTPEQLADAVVEGLRAERFLILPHPEVAEYFQRKASDYDRWLSGMRRLQRHWLGDEAAES